MRAIVLKRSGFRENDQVVSFYTSERGKISLLARGVKKITSKNSSHLEPFTLVDIDFVQGKEIDHLTKVQPLRSYKNIRADFQKSFVSSYICVVLDRVVEMRHKDEPIFNLLASWLEFLDIVDNNVNGSMLSCFIIKLFSNLGFQPELEKCVVCGNSIEDDYPGLYFAGGGVVCEKDCQIKFKSGECVEKISLDELKSLRALLDAGWTAACVLQNKKERRLLMIIHGFAQFHSEKKLPAVLTIEKILRKR